MIVVKDDDHDVAPHGSEDRFYDAQPSKRVIDRVTAQSKGDAAQAVPDAPSAAYVSAVPSTIIDASQRLLFGTVNQHLADGT